MKFFVGIISIKTFTLTPKLQIINLMNCKIEKVWDGSFASLKELKSLDIRGTAFSIEINTFADCKLKSLYLTDLEINLENLSQLKYVEDITFTNCKFSIIKKDVFSSMVSLNTLTFSSCEINIIDVNAFDDISKLVELRFSDCTIDELNCNSFLKLTSLQHLTLQGSTFKQHVNYNIFKNLPLLESIFFDLNVYKDLDFSGYLKLKTVRIGFNDENEETEEDLRKYVISKLNQNEINYELVFTGKVEVDMNDVQICC